MCVCVCNREIVRIERKRTTRNRETGKTFTVYQMTLCLSECGRYILVLYYSNVSADDNINKNVKVVII